MNFEPHHSTQADRIWSNVLHDIRHAPPPTLLTTVAPNAISESMCPTLREKGDELPRGRKGTQHDDCSR